MLVVAAIVIAGSAWATGLLSGDGQAPTAATSPPITEATSPSTTESRPTSSKPTSTARVVTAPTTTPRSTVIPTPTATTQGAVTPTTTPSPDDLETEATDGQPELQSLCGSRAVRAHLETARFDVSICGPADSPTYIGVNRETGDGITLPACARNDHSWLATNEGHEYVITVPTNGVPFLVVRDPDGEAIVNEIARTINGQVRWDPGLGHGGFYCS